MNGYNKLVVYINDDTQGSACVCDQRLHAICWGPFIMNRICHVKAFVYCTSRNWHLGKNERCADVMRECLHRGRHWHICAEEYFCYGNGLSPFCAEQSLKAGCLSLTAPQINILHSGKWLWSYDQQSCSLRLGRATSFNCCMQMSFFYIPIRISVDLANLSLTYFPSWQFKRLSNYNATGTPNSLNGGVAGDYIFLHLKFYCFSQTGCIFNENTFYLSV